MLKSFKTEIAPSQEQKVKIHKTIGTCRFIYNFYLTHNKELHEQGKKFMSAKSFSVWMNREYLPEHPDMSWIGEVSSKAIKQSMENANRAFTRFFKRKSVFPKFKKKSIQDVKMYFVKTDSRAVIRCERHRIKIPTLGWVKIKEKGYIPTTTSGYVIKSGTVSRKADRYYVSVLVEVPDTERQKLSGEGLGIDLGLKNLAVLSNGIVYKNINKTARLKRIEKQLKREQRCLSRKYLSWRSKTREEIKNSQKGKPTQRANICKQTLRVQKLHQRTERIRTDHINKIIDKIVKTKPSYIVIEELNVSGMMKNRHLSKAVASQKFYEFRTKLKAKCDEYGIELRIVDRFYPSSKMCHSCGAIKKDLKLSDRVYICGCGYKEDRDYNASLNLRDAKTYTVA